ncbi:hypothetical protein LCGC14_1227350 [marine sediment metagenome]|uniref:Uncharacterized protein n=1 Tax=marine sediment metagenome TaxID=412755 RepID=A0A0F9NRT4_9ZZZZ
MKTVGVTQLKVELSNRLKLEGFNDLIADHLAINIINSFTGPMHITEPMHITYDIEFSNDKLLSISNSIVGVINYLNKLNN